MLLVNISTNFIVMNIYIIFNVYMRLKHICPTIRSYGVTLGVDYA